MRFVDGVGTSQKDSGYLWVNEQFWGFTSLVIEHYDPNYSTL